MKKEELRQSITELDADLVEEFCLTDGALQSRKSAARTRAKMRGRLPKILISAACFLLILGLAIPLSLKIADRQESGSGIWKLESNQGYLLCISYQPSYANRPYLRLNADYSKLEFYGPNGIVTLNSEISQEMENDPGVRLYGQWMYSYFSSDCRLHYSLFHPKAVERLYTAKAQKYGYDFEGAMERLDRLMQVYKCMTTECNYSLISMTEVAKSDLSKETILNGDHTILEFLEEDGVDLSEISEIRKYNFDGLQININGKFTTRGSIFDDLVIYRCKDQWYILGCYMETDDYVDLLSDSVDSDFEIKEYESIVVEIGEEYMLLEKIGYDEYSKIFALIYTEPPKKIKVGDTVRVQYSGELHLDWLEEDAGPDGRYHIINVFCLLSVEKIPMDEVPSDLVEQYNNRNQG